MVSMRIAILVAFIVIIFSYILKAVNWVWLKPKKLERYLRKQGLSGNSYRFLFGDVKEMFRMRTEARENPIPFTNDYFHRVLPFLHQHVNKYGDNCFTWFGPVPMINITDPRLIRDVLTRTHEFKKPKLHPLIGLLAPGLFSYEGEKWAKHRKLINPAFHMEKLKLMLPAFSASVIEMMSNWEKVISETGSSEIDVWPYLTSLSADALSRAAFGSNYEEGGTIFELLKQQSELALRLLQSVYLPGWKYVPTKNNKRMKELDGGIRSLLKEIIDKRKKAMEAGEVAKDDLLGILMDSNFNAIRGHGSNKQHLGMSFQEMIDECKLFYLAGQETTSGLLVWTMILLSKHQHWQEKARDEVLEILGKNQPNFDDLNHLKTVTMILYEVLRLYPPLLSFSRRVYDRETKLGDLIVPPGAMVDLSIIHCHHDSKIWGDDVKAFKPERFSEGIAKATRGNIAFFPFSWGPRICIGQNFAMVEAKIALSMILQRFSFELSPSYLHAPTNFVTLNPQCGAHLVLCPLKGCE